MFRKHLTALAVLGIVIGGFAVASVSCSIYHMQTPQTVPPGKWSGGAALSAYGGGTSSGLIYFPGFWIRRGITPRLDVGLHTWMAGLKVDTKYNVIKDYLSVGLGLAGGVLPMIGEGEFLCSYIIEGSLYTGYPAKVLSPYITGRVSAAGFWDWHGIVLSTIAGLRLRPFPKLSLYTEAGRMWSLTRGDIDFVYTGGVGVSYGY